MKLLKLDLKQFTASPTTTPKQKQKNTLTCIYIYDFYKAWKLHKSRQLYQGITVHVIGVSSQWDQTLTPVYNLHAKGAVTWGKQLKVSSRQINSLSTGTKWQEPLIKCNWKIWLNVWEKMWNGHKMKGGERKLQRVGNCSNPLQGKDKGKARAKRRHCSTSTVSKGPMGQRAYLYRTPMSICG